MDSNILERFFEKQHRLWKTKAHGLFENARRGLRWRSHHAQEVNPNPPGTVLARPEKADHGMEEGRR